MLALAPGPWADVFLGAALGLGVWVRPNMGLLVAVVAAWFLFRREWHRLARTALAVAPFLVAEALLNWHLFGVPWRTGYGEIPFGDAPTEILARGGRYLLKLNVQQGGVGLGLFALALLWSRLARAHRFLLAGVFGTLLCFFAAYRFDDAWWYLRFLVPAFPAVVLVEAGFFVRLAKAAKFPRLRRAATVLLVCGLALGEWLYGSQKRIYTLKDNEQRYPNAARLAASVVRPPAVVLSMQHSGSLRYFSGLATARYDTTTPETLAAALVGVSARGGRAYLVADDWELERMANGERRFLLAGASPLGHVTPGYTAVYLLDPEEAADTLRRGAAVRHAAAEEATFEGGWDRAGPVWHVRGTGVIGLPAEGDPAVARVCASETALALHRPGFPVEPVAANACTDVPLLPGPSGELGISAGEGGSAALPAVKVLPLGALLWQGSLSTSYMVPQVARVAGRAGSFWQTDLVLVNPQATPLRITGTFLRSLRDNSRAYAATTVVPARAAVTIRDVLKVPEFEWLGGRGAMIAYAGEPGKPCGDPACRFLLCARTYNVLATVATPDAGEWLPGLPANAAMIGGRATFTRVGGGDRERASVGLASWSDSPMKVRVRAGSSSGGTGAVRETVVAPFGHARLDLGEWPPRGEVEVELVAPAPDARLFPYLSVVDGATGAARHLLPDEISARRGAGRVPMPKALSSGFKRGL